MTQPTPASGRQRDFVIWLDKLIYQLSKHWLAVFNCAVFIYVGLPFAAPVLMEANLPGPANVIYAAYSPLCHQFAFRSWFLFGDRPYYEAGDPIWKSLNIDPFDVLDRFKAKSFNGNAQMGFKVAYCERDTAIYGAIFLAGLVFALIRQTRKIRPVNIILYVLIGIAPIALDGFSQLFSEQPFNFIPLRESTPYLRVLTGVLFGAMNVWLAYPYLEESFAEIKVDLQAKLGRIGQLPGGGAAPAGD